MISTGRVRPAWKSLAIALGILVLTVTATEAHGQRRSRTPPPEMGLRTGYEFRGKDWSIGGQARAPLARGSDLIFSGDYFFASGTNFQLNMDLALPFMPGGGFYGGAGLGVAFTNVNVSTGLATTWGGNLFVGLAPYKSKRKGLRWFVEWRLFVREGQNPMMVVIGLNTPLGG